MARDHSVAETSKFLKDNNLSIGEEFYDYDHGYSCKFLIDEDGELLDNICGDDCWEEACRALKYIKVIKIYNIEEETDY